MNNHSEIDEEPLFLTAASVGASYGAGAMGVGNGGASSSTTGNPSSPSTPTHENFSSTPASGMSAAISVGGDGGSGGAAGSTAVTSSSLIVTVGDSSQGIFAQSVGGGGGSGGASISNDGSTQYSLSGGVGGFGGSGGTGSTVLVTASNAIITFGLNSAGIYAQSIGGGGGKGGSTDTAAGASSLAVAVGVGGFGGSGNSADLVKVTNSAQIVTLSQASPGIFAQSIGGGGGDGGSSFTSATESEPPKASSSSNTAAQTGALPSSMTTSAGSSAAAGKSTTQNGSQAGNDEGSAYGISIGGFGGSGGNAGGVVVANTGSIATGLFAKLSDSIFVSQAPPSSPSTTVSADYSYAIFAQSVGGGGGNGGQSSSNADATKASLAISLGGYGAGGGNGQDVTVTNSGVLVTQGEFSAAIFAQSVGGGGGNGGDSISTSSLMSAKSDAFGLGGAGAAGGNGGNISVTSSIGSISTRGNFSEGIIAQSVGGGGGYGGSSSTAVNFTEADLVRAASTSSGYSETSSSTNGGVALAAGLGGAGGFGQGVSVTNASSIVTRGNESSGIFAQSVGGGGGNAGSNTNSIAGASYTLSMNLGGLISAGAFGSGGAVTVLSNATIATSGHSSFDIFAQSVGGGGGSAQFSNSTLAYNSSVIDPTFVTATLGASGGSGVVGGTVNIGIQNTSLFPVTGTLVTIGSDSAGIVAQSIGGGGGMGTSNNLTQATGPLQVSSTLGANSGNTNGDAGPVQIYSNAVQTTAGSNSPGVLAQSVGGGGGYLAVLNLVGESSSLTATGSLGSSGGSSGLGNGVLVNLGGGSIVTNGVNSMGVIGQSVSGGGGIVSNIIYAGTGGSLSFQTSLGANGSSATSYSAASPSPTISIASAATIMTFGANGIGIMAQSVNGGGGISSTYFSGGSITLSPSYIGGQSSNGDGLAVSVTQTGSISTSGPAAMGIVAQSIGGGGGYISLASQSGASVINGSNIVIGGSSSSSGNGGNVVITVNAPITTSGKGSVGIVAQSVGGGGGILATSGISGLTPVTTGGTGNGGAVSVTINAPIIASGAGAYGVVAQSVGGGGGMMINENGVTDYSANAGGNGGAVAVVDNSSITAIGGGALGIYAKSLGGLSDPSITIAHGASVIASGGGSAIVVDGLINSITNNGYIGVANPVSDTAIQIIGAGGTTSIVNNGVLSGAINNQGSSLNFTNSQGAVLYLPGALNLGGGTFTNAGFLQFNPQGSSLVGATTQSGSFTQTGTGTLGVKVNLNAGQADLLEVTPGNTFNLAGNIKPVLLNAGLIAPGIKGPITILENSGGSLVDNQLGVFSTAIVSFDVAKQSNGIQLSATANFAPAGLSNYGGQLGGAIGSYQAAGSSALFQAATAQLVTIPTVGGLDQAYNKLAGSAIAAVPQVTYQAVSRGMGTVSDRLNSWRVGDSFITQTKGIQGLMYGVGGMGLANAPPVPQMAAGNVSFNPASLVADGSLPSAQYRAGDYRAWITPFQDNISTNSLSDTVYGGSFGVESESVDRKYIGGIGFTISQSSYTYSSANMPSTPGSDTNYGAAFYAGAREESAYLSAIAYLGGSNSGFSRQLQGLGFDSTTNVTLHSNVMAARIEAGYNLMPHPEGQYQLQLTPFAAIQPTQIRQNGANEYFNGLGSGFYYGSNINTAVPVYVGAEFSGQVDLGDNQIVRPFLRVSWVGDLMSQSTMNAAYSPGYGVSLYSNGSPSFGNAVLFKGGAKYNWGTNVSAYATINVEQGNASYNYRGIGGSIGAMYAW